MKKTPRFIKAISPVDLVKQVQEETGNGNGMGLYQPLFVSHEGLLVQAVITVPCLYEYRLIVAADLEDLELQIKHLITNLGFDSIFNVVLWNGMYLQWMFRTDDTEREDLVQVFAAPREDELRLVEDVRKYLGMHPIAKDALPFPVLS